MADRALIIITINFLSMIALQVPDESLQEYLGKWEDPPYDGKNSYLPHPHPRAAYAAMVSRMDRTLGRMLNLLKDTYIMLIKIGRKFFQQKKIHYKCVIGLMIFF